jgi:hypothetical protein
MILLRVFAWVIAIILMALAACCFAAVYLFDLIFRSNKTYKKL